MTTQINIYIMIGLPGSAKSYKSHQIVLNNKNTVIINRDKIREMLAGDYKDYDFKWESLTSSIKKDSIENAIDRNFNIIIDETHITKKSRLKELNHIVQYCSILQKKYNIIYIWCTENKNNLKYRMKTPKNCTKELWKKVINNMKKSFENPSEDEGYNELIEYKVEL